MKTGKTLVELATELQRIKATARDFVVPTEMLRAQWKPSDAKDNGEVTLGFDGAQKQEFRLTPWAGQQLATYSDIPKAYFDRLAIQSPALLADNVNHGLHVQASAARRDSRQESRMLRTLDGNVRGLLSSRYRILDSHDMLDAIFPVLSDKGMEVVSSELTERRMFVKALSPRLKADVKPGDTVQYGLVISTSDVGAGSVRVEPLIYRLVCANGMISNTAIRKYHVGKNQAESEIQELLSDKTREVSDAAFWMQVRDIVLHSLKPENFEREVDRLRVAANEEIKNFDLPRVVELTMKETAIYGEGKKNSILHALASGGEGSGLTRWGLVNAFTRAAQAANVSYEESIELERAGGQILELPKNAWQMIASTA